MPGAVASTFNLAILEAELRKGVSSTPVKGSSSSMGEWIA